jgi:hypothetical protein
MRIDQAIATVIQWELATLPSRLTRSCLRFANAPRTLAKACAALPLFLATARTH